MDSLCSDITAETGGEDANWRDVVHWLMLRWSQNSRALPSLAPRFLQQFILHEFILRESTNSPIPTTIKINMTEAVTSSKNFSHGEIMHFLGLMEEIIPMGNEEMKLVASQHAEAHPPGRSALSLRRKFASLQRVKHPTGDPNMPEEIQMAKTIWHDVGKKADVGAANKNFSGIQEVH